MKKQFVLVLLAVLSVSAFAEAKEIMISPRKSEQLFNDLAKHGAETIEEGHGYMIGFKKIALGDIICSRTPNRRLESITPFYYSCTQWVEDAYLPAYPDSNARSNSGSSKRVQ